MLRIAIVDDHEIVRDGLREILSSESGFEIAFEASSGESALEQIRLQKEQLCDVLLLDLSLPKKTGVDVLREFRQRFPEVHILILSSYSEEQYALRMIDNGADGYLCKDCSGAELIKAIRTVSIGRKYLSPSTIDLIARGRNNPKTSFTHESLSEREMQVFLHLASGKSVGEVASMLCLSVKTISTYRTRVMEKLQLTSNAELAVYALRHGLLPNEVSDSKVPPLVPLT